MGEGSYADQSQGVEWQTEEDAFVDGYHANAPGGEHVTYERLRAMGTNGFQEPAVGFQDGKIVGSTRLYTDGVFSTDDGRARFMDAPWRGLQAPWQGAAKGDLRLPDQQRAHQPRLAIGYLDVQNEFVMDRWPYPFIEMNPDDMAEVGVAEDDLVEVYNDAGATQAMVYPTATARRGETFMLFAYPTGVQGKSSMPAPTSWSFPTISRPGATSERAPIGPAVTNHVTFKSQEYKTG